MRWEYDFESINAILNIEHPSEFNLGDAHIDDVAAFGNRNFIDRFPAMNLKRRRYPGDP
jgi:hypothetical protein